jgi:hypothetical protein
MPMLPKRRFEPEGLRSWYDAMKHLSTLCTGTLVLLVSFVEKIFPPAPKWKLLFPVVLVFLLISVFTALLCMLYISEILSTNNHNRINRARGSYLVSLASFFIGLLILVVFSIKNFS